MPRPSRAGRRERGDRGELGAKDWEALDEAFALFLDKLPPTKTVLARRESRRESEVL